MREGRGKKRDSRFGNNTVWWTKSRCCRCSGWAGVGQRRGRKTQTRCLLSQDNTSLTTFHRSLTRESTLRMSACSAPPLMPSADQGCSPHCFPPPSTGGLRPGRAFGWRLRTLRKAKRHKTVSGWGTNVVHEAKLHKLMSKWISVNAVWKSGDSVNPQAYRLELCDTRPRLQLPRLLPAAVSLDKLTPTSPASHITRRLHDIISARHRSFDWEGLTKKLYSTYSNYS